jgi:hypothetical protein
MKFFLIAVITMTLSFSLSRAAQGGNGKISGIVIQAGTARPIDGVQVFLSPLTPQPGQPPNQVGGLTDQFGRFEVDHLPAGRYRIQWNRPGYFTPPVGTAGPDPPTIQSLKSQLGIGALYIASPPAATSVTVDLGSQENLEGFVFALIPGGVISGRLLDPMGNPLVSASLTALTLSYEDGVKVLRPGTSTTSDDRGEFRLFGLRPGEYYVRADYRRQPLASGEIVRVYFPGVPALSDATPIIVNESGESPGANFSISNSGTAKILGRILGPADMPPPSNVQFCLLPSGVDRLEDSVPISMRNFASGAANPAQGEFELHGIPPGQYQLCAFIYDNAQKRSYNGRVAVNVGAQDLQSVVIEMHREGDVKGRVMLDDGSAIRIPLTLRLRDPQAAVGRTPSPSINQDANGAFVIEHVPEARYSLTHNASDSCIVDLRQGGRSVYDDGFIGGMDAEAIDVIVSKQCGTIQVQILDDRQQQIPNAFVSLVPAAEHRRNPLLYRRSIFDVAAAKYPAISLIPPGEYKMFAWDSIPPNAELNPEFLARFENRGVPVTIRRGESLTVQLPLITTKN